MSNSKSAHNLDLSLSTDQLSEEDSSTIAEEDGVCSRTVSAISSQIKDQERRFDRERVRARDLTATLVQSRRDEERAMVASEEAVSHALAHHHDETLETLRMLRERPYFGRVVLEEEHEETGDLRKIEYKIGHAANPDCRIIDWRKAPLSKLYYEYREGDDYAEVIQGRERCGRIALRNRVEINHSELTQVDATAGSFRKIDGTWKKTGGKGAHRSRDLGALPDVLSLITPEQFTTITHDASSAVLLQGVAGSGKTTVALHRLSWLLGQQEHRLLPEDAVILTLGPSMSSYIKSTLPQLQIRGVKVFSYREWAGNLIAQHLPKSLLSSDPATGLPVLSSGHLKPPASTERVKRSLGLLLTIEERAKTGASSFDSALELLLASLSDYRRVIELDDSRLITREVLSDAFDRTKDMVNRGTLDRSDFSLLLRCVQVLGGVHGSVAYPGGPFRHVVVDEVQDYSPVELATVLSTLTTDGTLTLVGDIAQQTEDGFPGWKRLQGWWNNQKRSSSFVKLDVSHRCTREIMRCAEILGSPDDPPAITRTSLGRSGARPRWLIGRDQELALSGLMDWLSSRMNENPTGLIAVVGFSAAGCRELRGLLSPNFGSAVRYIGDDGLSFEEGIVIGDPQSLKGLEFFAVAIWGAMKPVVPSGEMGPNLLYIAATRAQEYLAFVTWGRGGSPLSRIPLPLLQREEIEQMDTRNEPANPFATSGVFSADDAK